MDITTQLMTAISLAACAGLRAWLPLLIAGLLARGGYIHLNPSYAFLSQNGALAVFAVATILEFTGDKIIGIDHLQDVLGSFARPASGALLAASALPGMDPAAATALGILLGGGAALTVHGGKAIIRTKSTLLAPFHGGLGNSALSVLEDLLAAGGAALAVFQPLLAAILALLMILAAGIIIVLFLRTGKKLIEVFRRRPVAQ